MNEIKRMGKMKLKMKRIAACTLATTLLALTCVGCGEKTNSTSKTQISVGEWPTVEGTALTNLNKNKEDFEKQNPDITIIPDTWTFDLQTFYPKAAAGLLPNLFRTHFTEMSKLLDGEYVASLTDAMKKDGSLDNLNPVFMNAISKDGEIYAVPSEAYSLGLLYNVEMFEKAGLMNADGTPQQPKDWNEMVEFAVKLKETTGKPGLVLPTSNKSGGWYFTNIGWSFGVKFMEQQEDGKWKAKFNSDEAVQALQFIKDLKWKYDILPANTLIDQNEMNKTYATGGAAMMLGAGGTASNLATYETDPNIVGVMAIPAGPRRHVSLLGGTLKVVSSKSSESQVEAALKWLEFIGNSYKLTDEKKEMIEKKYNLMLENNQLVGVKGLSPWNDDSEFVAYDDRVREEKANINLNHVKLYNDSLKDSKIELQSEEPVCAQDLYGILDTCIQAVLEDKDADCRALLEKANADFQTNYLDNIDY